MSPHDPHHEPDELQALFDAKAKNKVVEIIEKGSGSTDIAAAFNNV